jgi:hypothetical protein
MKTPIAIPWIVSGIIGKLEILTDTITSLRDYENGHYNREIKRHDTNVNSTRSVRSLRLTAFRHTRSWGRSSRRIRLIPSHNTSHRPDLRRVQRRPTWLRTLRQTRRTHTGRLVLHTAHERPIRNGIRIAHSAQKTCTSRSRHSWKGCSCSIDGDIEGSTGNSPA